MFSFLTPLPGQSTGGRHHSDAAAGRRMLLCGRLAMAWLRAGAVQYELRVIPGQKKTQLVRVADGDRILGDREQTRRGRADRRSKRPATARRRCQRQDQAHRLSRPHSRSRLDLGKKVRASAVAGASSPAGSADDSVVRRPDGLAASSAAAPAAGSTRSARAHRPSHRASRRSAGGSDRAGSPRRRRAVARSGRPPPPRLRRWLPSATGHRLGLRPAARSCERVRPGSRMTLVGILWPCRSSRRRPT